jgi:hypothetical protein
VRREREKQELNALAEAEARVNGLLLAAASKYAVAADETENALRSEILRSSVALSSAETDRNEWRREALRARESAFVEVVKNNDADGFLNGILRADQDGLFEGNGLLRIC